MNGLDILGADAPDAAASQKALQAKDEHDGTRNVVIVLGALALGVLLWPWKVR